MRVLVVGGGGREHALVHAFCASPLATQVFCAPGNAGIEQEADPIAIGSDDLDGLLAFAKREHIDLTVVGPEAPLVAGIADLFTEHGLLVFGPTAEAARLEGSKAFAKEIMGDAHVATGSYRRHDDLDAALRDLAGQETWPLVVKADGLAAGKGVIICRDAAEAEAAVRLCLDEHAFGEAGGTVLLEEFLSGPEVSLLALCDGTRVVPMAPAQDYKRIFAGDQGPNTGGMGSYCPVPGFTDGVAETVAEELFRPVLEALRRRGIDYRGVLYGGLIVTEHGVKLLEFNCRFGDPETQAILPRLDSDLLEACLATARGELDPAALRWKPEACVSIVMASRGYPASSSKGDVISGLSEAAALPDVTIYHAATAVHGHDIVTSGGRVLAVSALGEHFAGARERAYGALARISFAGAQSRPDIAERAVRAEAGEIALFPPALAD
ncbi:MAG TPA: phosphoribosylamine--glycine ligase [Thermoleophilia bacterium]|nr:phosphoribosylamine--glycine ligase [Thermoleophilia bacterium]